MAVKQLAAEADLVLIVGSTNSSNSLRLVEVARAAGADAARLVDNAEAVDAAWLREATTVGLTSGASAPEILVQEVLALLARHGFTQVEAVTVAEEHIRFSPPRELVAPSPAGARNTFPDNLT